jgi:hypothetical protein
MPKKTPFSNIGTNDESTLNHKAGIILGDYTFQNFVASRCAIMKKEERRLHKYRYKVLDLLQFVCCCSFTVSNLSTQYQNSPSI